jgi:hypothetical protein
MRTSRIALIAAGLALVAVVAAGLWIRWYVWSRFEPTVPQDAALEQLMATIERVEANVPLERDDSYRDQPSRDFEECDTNLIVAFGEFPDGVEMTYDVRYEPVAVPSQTVDAVADMLAADGFEVTRDHAGDDWVVQGRDDDRDMAAWFYASRYGEVALRVTQEGCYPDWPE